MDSSFAWMFHVERRPPTELSKDQSASTPLEKGAKGDWFASQRTYESKPRRVWGRSTWNKVMPQAQSPTPPGDVPRETSCILGQALLRFRSGEYLARIIEFPTKKDGLCSTPTQSIFSLSLVTPENPPPFFHGVSRPMPH